ncbi:ABC transporter substrate-binding protein [Bradyrhizobium manausense]|uniref:ABC transporter substrate-binding protein n=1 Tax=Bradyrhizobium manausense TaxID=989370 RepID=UPI002013798D|nr:ABC transporter substrate-binding protein [Bradyrhizobium manausense]
MLGTMRWIGIAIGVATTLLTTATFAAGPTCPDGPIRIGSITSATGPVDFSDAPKAAKALFDATNAVGGIDGCRIAYELADDKADPQVAAQAARDLIENKKVVTMAGGASLLECAVNSQLYKRSNLSSIPGLGVNPVCFVSSNIAPVNVGPYTLETALGLFATSQLRVKNVCVLLTIIGGSLEAHKAALARWEAISGQKAKLVDLTVPTTGDYTPFVIRARDAGCEAVISNAVEPTVVAIVKTADAQKISGINWMFLSPGYSVEVGKALAATQQAVYAGTEWEPYTDQNSDANKEWISAMNSAGLPLTAFSQGGYLSARVIIDVIKGIDGPVTRDSVSKALSSMNPVSYSLAGSQYVFGSASTHAPMQATKVMKLEKGNWTVATKDWFVVPSK